MSLGTLAIRGVIGPLFVGHGAQKLFGLFGGHGLQATGAAFEQMGMRPGRRNALMAGGAEAGGGMLLTLGALTPLGASMIIGTMTTAVRKVHGSNGPWMTDGGWEYNAAVVAATTAVVAEGPGRPSFDGDRFRGAGWALAAVAAGVAGSFLIDRLNDGAPAAPEPTDAAAPATPAAQAADAVQQAAGR